MTYTVDAEEKFVVGSTNFFDGIDGFESKDVDELWILKKPLFGKQKSFLIRDPKVNKDYILYPKFTKEEFIEYDLKKNDKILLGKYISPEFAKYIELSLEDLRKLEKLVDILDEKHIYQKIIYEAYLTNGDFILTDEQRLKAYESYKKSRV